MRSDSPALQERNHNPKLISMSMMTSSGSSFAVRTQMASPLAKWAMDGVKAPGKGEPEKNRMLGVSPPINGALAALKSAFAVVSLVNADNNAYSSDENMRIGNYIDGIRIMVSMMTTPFPEEENEVNPLFGCRGVNFADTPLHPVAVKEYDAALVPAAPDEEGFIDASGSIL